MVVDEAAKADAIKRAENIAIFIAMSTEQQNTLLYKTKKRKKREEGEALDGDDAGGLVN